MYYQIIVFTQTVFWTKSLKTIKMLLLTETRVERQQNNEGQSDVWRGGGDCPEGHMSGHCGDGACTHDQTGIRTKINRRRRRRRRRRRLAGRDSTQVRAMTTPVNTPPILQYSAPASSARRNQPSYHPLPLSLCDNIHYSLR